MSSRTIRYVRAWVSGPADFVEEEIVLDREGLPVPATVVRPPGPRVPRPAWVVMHGITRPGRAHAQLVRLTRTLASAGLVTVVPEVPEWRELRLSPHLTVPTIAAALRGLRDTGLALDEPVGLVGFSFGAPHTIASVSHPEIRDQIAGACGFGGYSNLDATFRFMMTGRHEWGGKSYVRRPDPYGRWIVAANYLTAVPGHEDSQDVADALRQLAAHAGDEGAASWDAVYDPVIGRLRSRIDEARRTLFDAFARPSDAPTSGESTLGLADELAAAAQRIDPAIDPSAELARVDVPVSILHGRNDHLIPFTEAFRLNAALRSTTPHVTVTRLFGHSAQDPFPYGRALREVPAFLKGLDRFLRMV